MNVVYRNWEPDQGLEEIQAKIQKVTTGILFPLEQIREENNRRGSDMCRFALTQDGKPLAFADSTDSPGTPGRTYISYPYAMPECPPEVQENIFNDLKEHLENREATSEIVATIQLFLPNVEEKFDFFHKHGFIEEHRQYLYNQRIDIEDASAWHFDDAASKLTCRQATHDDYDILYELLKLDTELRREFQDEKHTKNYLERRVLKDGHVILLFDGNTAVAASAPLRIMPDGMHLFGEDERIVMRFTAIRPTYSHAWKRLVQEVAKECVRVGWTDLSLEILAYFRSYSSVAMGLEYLRPELMPRESLLILKN
jgi:hypothetical protein